MKAIVVKKKKMKSVPQLKAEVQVHFNNYIRSRDSKDNTFTCISCGKTLPCIKMNAGHYFPVKGFGHLRFNEDNVNGECQSCNGFSESHLIFYTWNLIEKIGLDRYNKLLEDALIKHPEYTRENLNNLLTKYKALNQ